MCIEKSPITRSPGTLSLWPTSPRQSRAKFKSTFCPNRWKTKSRADSIESSPGNLKHRRPLVIGLIVNIHSIVTNSGGQQ
ncbi:hypothetical protein M8J75_006004 [Diaphorina citri]|nr:hypothetical protein M8J75_006004 [Diaphorina citri]